MIEARNIHVTFNRDTPLENKALRGVTLTIPKGEFVCVIGSNGAGKSTLLNVIAGEISPIDGRLFIDDEDVTKRELEERAPYVARVFQDPLAGTCEGLSIEENMALADKRGQLRGLRPAIKEGRKNLYRSKLQDLGLGLENRLGDRIGLLSGGQRQAISLVMATLCPMKILLLDEHTAALDPKMAKFIMVMTDSIVRKNGLTALMVTHSVRQALDYGDRTIMLHAGKVVLDVSGPERKDMTVEDVLHLYENKQKQTIDDDALVFG